MSQNFRELLATGIIKDDREAINDNFEDVRSCSSGTAYPTSNLVEGMLFFNTDTKKLYELMPDLATWTMLFDLSSGVAYVAKAGNADGATKATNDVNNKALTSYVAKLEQNSDNAFVIEIYDGTNTKIGTINIPETKISVMTGATPTTAGTEGLVPTPPAGSQNKALCGDGTFKILPVEGGGTDATTASEALANLGGLPLSGGVMTGSIITNGDIIVNSIDDFYVNISGGSSYNTGANLTLYGNSHQVYPGKFILNTGQEALIGDAYGHLSWAGTKIITSNDVMVHMETTANANVNLPVGGTWDALVMKRDTSYGTIIEMTTYDNVAGGSYLSTVQSGNAVFVIAIRHTD